MGVATATSGTPYSGDIGTAAPDWYWPRCAASATSCVSDHIAAVQRAWYRRSRASVTHTISESKYDATSFADATVQS